MLLLEKGSLSCTFDHDCSPGFAGAVTENEKNTEVVKVGLSKERTESGLRKNWFAERTAA